MEGFSEDDYLSTKIKRRKLATLTGKGTQPSLPSPEVQLQGYLDSIEDSDDLIGFWEDGGAWLNSLSKLALSALSIPTTLAPVDRVFSYGG